MADQARNIIGQGWAFPIKPGPDGRLHYLTGDEKIRQAILLILNTAAGERQMRPNFGCGVHELLFEANTAALRGVVQQKIREALTLQEPRIDVLDVRAETDEQAGNQLLIYIAYRVRSNNALYNLVYPFYLTEGPR